MDEAENKAPESGSENMKNDPPASSADAATEAARDAAGALMGDAQKDLNEIKGRGIKGFFNFDKFYFPIIARYLFILVCILSVVGMVFGILGGFVAIFRLGVIPGLSTMLFSILGGLVGIIGTRVWFEMILLGFTINENLEKIRDK